MEPKYHYNEHDLAEIFRSVWGYTAFPFLFKLQNKVEAAIFKKKGNGDIDYNLSTYLPRKEYNVKGVPYYANNSNGNEMFMPVWLIHPDGSELLLQNTVTSLSNKKTIVETPLVNRQGTVKEEICIEDWEINVKGLIVSADNDYPDVMVQDLQELYKEGTSLGIQNARTSLVLDSEIVVIRSLKFPELKGMKHIQAFEMDLTSDIAFKLIIE